MMLFRYSSAEENQAVISKYSLNVYNQRRSEFRLKFICHENL